MGFKDKQVGNERMEILGHAQMFTPNTGAPKVLPTGMLVFQEVEFQVPQRRTGMKHRFHHLQQVLLRHNVLGMKILLI